MGYIDLGIGMFGDAWEELENRPPPPGKLAPMIAPDLPYHPVYIFLSIGFAAFALSWMNDSGFWVVSRLSGMTEKETLKSFSVMLTIVSLAGLAVT